MRLDELPDLLTVDEYAQWARRGRNQAYQDIKQGRVPSLRLGRAIRIPKAGLRQLVNGAQTRDDPAVGGGAVDASGVGGLAGGASDEA